MRSTAPDSLSLIAASTKGDLAAESALTFSMNAAFCSAVASSGGLIAGSTTFLAPGIRWPVLVRPPAIAAPPPNSMRDFFQSWSSPIDARVPAPTLA